ncbi:Predicted arabinose efflux permease, MFS family [Paenibacillus polysaccharolyticus]|uniref:Predicted arabinose efflux permease, MFS family n=1 Tax=Paenibacillus polysaccharolyticus TaxID=582692 RepID=A0A1G5L7X7_9BACL|nr:MFS transporter [Paenibacillus polysaccharolyticus]SCZ08380.1 Predicted arabinose efflux permease, MFS family [Paenibacillus polysaccharolyticus]
MINSNNKAENLKYFTKRKKITASYYYLLIGDLLSRIGDYIYQLAIPLYVLYLTGSSVMMGISFAVEQAGLILSGLIAGTLVDRGNPKKIIQVTSVLQTIIVSTIPILHYLGVKSIYPILVVGFILIALNFLYRTAINSLIPLIVEKSLLPSASGKFSISRSISKTFGPLLAGLVLAAFDPINTLWLDALTFLIIFTLCNFITTSSNGSEIKNNDSKENELQDKENKRKFWRDTAEGFLIIFKNRSIFEITILNFFLNVGYVAMFAMLIFHLKDTLQYSTHQIAYVFTADGIGAFIAGMLLPYFMRKISTGYLILFSTLIMGISMVLVGWTHNIFLVGISFGILMFSSQINNRSIYTYWQAVVPHNQLGRVFSLNTMLEGVSVPIAGFTAGIVVDHLGSTILMQFCGYITLLVFLVFYTFSNIRKLQFTD